MDSRCWGQRPDVVTLSNDFAEKEGNSCFLVTRSGQQAQFLAALHGLGAPGGTELAERPGAVGFDGVFGNKEGGGDLAIAETARHEGENFELARGDAQGLLLARIRREGAGCVWSGRGWDLSHDDGLPNDFAAAGEAKAEPDAEGGEEGGDERAVELNGSLDDEEAILRELQDDDQQGPDE